ncbi:universal stress protein [Flaviaesturariibacter amylovorans]|uniref:Universal stress protein n=1 Tax=Flaviaesturariibacter amylovorans TaxID=1084520 RepID=A0ABP8GCL8_9BACT
MNTILVPTDFSLNADKAFDYALQIARRVAGEVIVLHVCALPLPEYATEPEGMREYNRLRAVELQLRLDQYRQRVAPDEWVRVRTLLVDGDTVDAIVKKAGQYSADLIVMGTRGAGIIKALLVGSHTAAVMAATDIPVIAVPDQYTGGLPDHILLAIAQEERESVLAPLFRLRALFGAGIRTITFSENDESAEELLEHTRTVRTATRKWKEAFSLPELPGDHIVGEDFFAAIDEYVDLERINLLAMVTHRRGGLQGLFQSSLTRKMAYHTHVPLISLHA